MISFGWNAWIVPICLQMHHIWKGTYWPVVLDLFFYLAAGRNMNAIKTLTIVNKPIAASASDQ